MLKCCNGDATGQNPMIGDASDSEVTPAFRNPTYDKMSPPSVNPASGDISSGDYMDLGDREPLQPSTYTEL